MFATHFAHFFVGPGKTKAGTSPRGTLQRGALSLRLLDASDIKTKSPSIYQDIILYARKSFHIQGSPFIDEDFV